MKASLLALTLTALALPALAEPDRFAIDPTHTFPSFEISHLGYSIQRGRFDRSQGQILIDREAKTGSLFVSIDARSIDTGLDELEKRLRSDDFFDTAQYPSITFESNRLVFDGDRLVRVIGDLTIMGVTRPVSLEVDHFRCAPHPMTHLETCGANATGTIKRSDFRMNKYLPMVGDDVKLSIQVEATRQ